MPKPTITCQITAVKSQPTRHKDCTRCVVPITYRVSLMHAEAKHIVHGQFCDFAAAGWRRPGATVDIDGTSLDGKHPAEWVVRYRPPLVTIIDCAEVSVHKGDSAPPMRFSHRNFDDWLAYVRQWHAAQKNGHGENEAIAYQRATSFAEAVRDALDAAFATVEIDLPTQPSPEHVFDYLRSNPPNCHSTGENDWRMGNYMGAGLVLAWWDGQAYQMEPWPDEFDIAECVSVVSKNIREHLTSEAKRRAASWDTDYLASSQLNATETRY